LTRRYIKDLATLQWRIASLTKIDNKKRKGIATTRYAMIMMKGKEKAVKKI